MCVGEKIGTFSTLLLRSNQQISTLFEVHSFLATGTFLSCKWTDWIPLLNPSALVPWEEMSCTTFIFLWFCCQNENWFVLQRPFGIYSFRLFAVLWCKTEMSDNLNVRKSACLSLSLSTAKDRDEVLIFCCHNRWTTLFLHSHIVSQFNKNWVHFHFIYQHISLFQRRLHVLFFFFVPFSAISSYGFC